MDYYSKYPEIIKIEDKSAGTIIAKMKAIFARHGIPEELMSDASKEFHQFASEWNIKLTTSSPLYPRSNGQSEGPKEHMEAHLLLTSRAVSIQQLGG